MAKTPHRAYAATLPKANIQLASLLATSKLNITLYICILAGLSVPQQAAPCIAAAVKLPADGQPKDKRMHNDMVKPFTPAPSANSTYRIPIRALLMLQHQTHKLDDTAAAERASKSSPNPACICINTALKQLTISLHAPQKFHGNRTAQTSSAKRIPDARPNSMPMDTASQTKQNTS